MNATIQKWGNSLALRIPQAVARDTHLQNGSVVNLAVRKGAVIIEPVKKAKYRLDDLLKACRKRIFTPASTRDRRSGREVW